MTQRVYLVTGCLGFLGKHLTERLLNQGHVVYGLDAETYVADGGWAKGWFVTDPMPRLRSRV